MPMGTQPLRTDPSLPSVPQMGDWFSEALSPPEAEVARGLPVIDSDREAGSLGYLLRANRGQLSLQGLRELYVEVLDLMKREVARGK